MNNFAELQWKDSTPRTGESRKQVPVQPEQKEVKDAGWLNACDMFGACKLHDTCGCVLSIQ